MTDDEVAGDSSVSYSTTTITTTTEEQHQHEPDGSRRRNDDPEEVEVVVLPDTGIGISIPLKGGDEHAIMNAEVREWEQVYPDKDVLTELKKARLWCLANPAKQKTRKGVGRFLNGWLARPANANAPPGRRSDAKSYFHGINKKKFEGLGGLL